MIKKLKNNNILNPYIQIGNRISSVRNNNDITIKELADSIEISVDKLKKIENGNSKISMDILMKIANSLNCDVKYFLTGLSDSILKNKVDTLTKYIDAVKLVSKLSPKEKDSLFAILKNITKK